MPGGGPRIPGGGPLIPGGPPIIPPLIPGGGPLMPGGPGILGRGAAAAASPPCKHKQSLSDIYDLTKIDRPIL